MESKKTNPSLCSKIQKKTSREVARMVSKKNSPKDKFSPENKTKRRFLASQEDAKVMASQEAFLRDSTIKPFVAKFHLNS